MNKSSPLVIAHRGACGYLPENTLAAKALAHGQGADYWESDVLATSDGELVVLHDLFLDEISDVKAQFANRARACGHYYVIDFTLKELRSLNLSERRRPDGQAQFATRFPPGRSRFQIHTLAEEIELLQGLNQSFARQMGLYLELKAPWFHADAGFDLSRAALGTLKAYGYTQPSDAVIVESFDAQALERIKRELMPELGVDLRLAQLVGYDHWQTTCERDANGNWVTVDSSWMLTPEGLSQIARYANTVAAAMSLLWQARDEGVPKLAPWLAWARARGLAIHTYTLRSDRLPGFAPDAAFIHDWLVKVAQVDGVFTDFPDQLVQYLQGSASSCVS